MRSSDRTVTESTTSVWGFALARPSLLAILPTRGAFGVAASREKPMPQSIESRLEAPPRLVVDTRVDFRSAALEWLDRAEASGSGRLCIDMSSTESVDASGLGTLVLVQKRARERGLKTRLVAPQPPIRTLLSITKLEPLFEIAEIA
jgi:anti-anti-sigma factor